MGITLTGETFSSEANCEYFWVRVDYKTADKAYEWCSNTFGLDDEWGSPAIRSGWKSLDSGNSDIAFYFVHENDRSLFMLMWA